MLLFSCQKTKYPWQPGISAPKYYPVGDVKIDFGNAGQGSLTNFDNGWGDEYGAVSGDRNKEIPKEVYIYYISAIDNLEYNGKVILPQEKILNLFREYDVDDDYWAHLVVGMAPGGWIRVWFTTIDVQVEVAKTKLKGVEDLTIGDGFRYKKSDYWKKYKIYWQHHGIPYSAWAENEKEYDIIFDFDKPNYRKVGFSYISADGTIYEAGREKAHQKLPVQLEQIAWLGKNEEAYNCKVPFPKNFKKYIEQKKLQKVPLRLEIEKDDEHAVIYLITNSSKEKIIRFKNKATTAEEKKNVDYDYAKEVEYFIK